MLLHFSTVQAKLSRLCRTLRHRSAVLVISRRSSSFCFDYRHLKKQQQDVCCLRNVSDEFTHLGLSLVPVFSQRVSLSLVHFFLFSSQKRERNVHNKETEPFALRSVRLKVFNRGVDFFLFIYYYGLVECLRQ